MRPYSALINYFQVSPSRSNPTTKHENNSLTLGGETPPLLRTPNSELRTPYFQASPPRENPTPKLSTIN